MRLIKKMNSAIQARGVIIVIRQCIAYILLKYTPIQFLSKRILLLRAFFLIGYWPNTKNPKTFNEKILHRRAFMSDPRASIIADKWLGRRYIEARGLKDILNEIYYVTSNPDTINFSALPQRFVIKANYASNLNIIVKNKEDLNIDEVVSKCNYWIIEQVNILKRNPEIHYRDIRPLIIIEKYLDSLESQGLLDYKFWCSGGKVLFISVQAVVNGLRVSSMYDKDWNLQPFSTGNKPIGLVNVNKPACLDKMIHIAERLCEGFSFLRVDLYCLNKSKIIFGELTYNPGGGTATFVPRKYDLELGKLLEL
ncbi:MAG: ATP-grasp fold amidoligase family protein [Candidatus Hatepunaea meridiana]|nr:ATP-grasp fold amidoligase family protein [Candidatus Hatepunaea meridiana]